MKHLFFMILVFINPILIFSQNNEKGKTSMEADLTKMRNLIQEADHSVAGQLTLRFIDAISGAPINDAQINITKIGIFTTNEEGCVVFPRQNDGIYAFNFSKSGYISVDDYFEIVVKTIFYNRFTMSPNMNNDEIRIVLDWDSRPSDLDLHLVKLDDFHVSEHNGNKSPDGTVTLNHAAHKGFGPETITIKKTNSDARFLCYVTDNTNAANRHSNRLSRSKARVKVFYNNSLKATYNIAQNGEQGNKWEVFSLEKMISTINKITN